MNKNSKVFTREFLLDFMDEFDLDKDIVLSNEIVDTWRWGNVHKMIFKFEGKIYSYLYRVHTQDGIQEYRDNITCPEVVAKQKLITYYEEVK